MTTNDKNKRIETTQRIEALLAEHCRRCPSQQSRAHWGTKCKPLPVCPVLVELQQLGKELGFTDPHKKEAADVDPDLLIRAMQNGIPESIYIARINAGRNPVEAAQVPHFRPRDDREFQELAVMRDIPRTTYGSRVSNGWTPQEAASYKQGTNLKQIRAGRASAYQIRQDEQAKRREGGQ